MFRCELLLTMFARSREVCTTVVLAAVLSVTFPLWFFCGQTHYHTQQPPTDINGTITSFFFVHMQDMFIDPGNAYVRMKSSLRLLADQISVMRHNVGFLEADLKLVIPRNTAETLNHCECTLSNSDWLIPRRSISSDQSSWSSHSSIWQHRDGYVLHALKVKHV